MPRPAQHTGWTGQGHASGSDAIEERGCAWVSPFVLVRIIRFDIAAIALTVPGAAAPTYRSCSLHFRCHEAGPFQINALAPDTRDTRVATVAPRLRQVSLSLRQSFARRSDSGTRTLVRNEQPFPLFSIFCKSSDAAGATVASKLRCQPQTQWQGRAG
ncbi:hypothetical protein SDC9_140570 [bioreactor metagenome]|uniref:Uncharacterized protein n=1 Tax=bioreactor metagenome TaxID=1076179 RepID=A0A645DXW2_9ZZZZ